MKEPFLTKIEGENMLYRVVEWKKDDFKVYDIGIDLSEDEARSLCHKMKRGYRREMEPMKMFEDEDTLKENTY